MATHEKCDVPDCGVCINGHPEWCTRKGLSDDHPLSKAGYERRMAEQQQGGLTMDQPSAAGTRAEPAP